MNMIPVQVVGLGMSPEDLTPRVREIIREAQVLVGGRRLLGYFPDHPAQKITPGERPGRHPRPNPGPGRGLNGWWCWPPGTPTFMGWVPWW